MGNFDNLRNAIAEVIKQNGNEEITGDVLQFVLLEMVSGLGAGYRFLGTCTPSTEPQEPDGAAFYVGGAGEYMNFNGVTVADGYICFFKWDGSAWSASPLKVSQPVDQEITDGGQNPVSGGAIFDEFKKLRDAGYLFAGLALLNTDPGEVTEKVFYIATQAGTYQYFGNGIILPWGLNIIKFNGSIWSSDTVFQMTDILESSSRALVTSGGVFTAIDGKVDKVPGKGLSEADFTNDEKVKLGALPTAAELEVLFEGKQDVLQFDGAPIPDSVHPVTSEGIYDAIKDFITKSVSDLLYYYTKSDTFNKTEVLNLIAAVKQFRYEVVPVLPDPSAETVGIIYFVPKEDPQPGDEDIKDEWITLTRSEGGTTEYYWERIGSTKIDLSDYTTFADVNAAIATALADYYTKQEIAAIIAAEEGKLADLSIEASKEVIQTGTSTSVMVTVRSTIEASAIILKRNGVVVMQGAGKSLQFNDVLEEALSGNVTYLAVLTIGGTERTTELLLPVVDPVYYGAALQASDVTTKATARKSPEGRYTVTAADDESYIFILVPMSMTVNGVEMSGLEMPMEAATGIMVGSLAYKCYQSSNTYDAGIYNINVY